MNLLNNGSGWMKKYDTVPICHDMFLDIKKFKGQR